MDLDVVEPRRPTGEKGYPHLSTDVREWEGGIEDLATVYPNGELRPNQPDTHMYGLPDLVRYSDGEFVRVQQAIALGHLLNDEVGREGPWPLGAEVELDLVTDRAGPED